MHATIRSDKFCRRDGFLCFGVVIFLSELGVMCKGYGYQGTLPIYLFYLSYQLDYWVPVYVSST